MPQETETVTGNPSQEQSNEDQKVSTDSNSAGNRNSQPAEAQVSSEDNSPPSVEACILKTNVPEASSTKESVSSDTESQQAQTSSLSSRPKSPEIIATETFLLNEQGSSERESQPILKSEPSETPEEQIPQETNVSSEPAQVPEPELVPQSVETTEPRTPANSEASEGCAPNSAEEPTPAHSEIVVVASIDEYTFTTVNGDVSEEPPQETKTTESEEPVPQSQLTNGQSNGECILEPRKVPEPEPRRVPEPEPRKVPEPEPEPHHVEKTQVLIDTIANELKAEDYKLPDVVEVKKHFEYIEPAHYDVSAAPPKKGALSTRLDSQSVKQAYEDVRYDGSETEWAVFKFEGPTIVTSATGSDFAKFRSHFGEDERAFGYIRVQTGDEMSKRAKFLLVTWVGPSVSVLKRAKMSTDKALMKGILSNFAVELQTENIADINLQNFVTELDKAAGAHYGTGVRG